MRLRSIFPPSLSPAPHQQISLFLQYRVQLPNGTLVLAAAGKLPVGAEAPGMIRYFGSEGENYVAETSKETAHGEEVKAKIRRVQQTKGKRKRRRGTRLNSSGWQNRAGRHGGASIVSGGR